MDQKNIQGYTREDAESDLTFAGFIIAECPLKPDTFSVMEELRESSHDVKMITGDNALTAAFIGQQLKYGNGTSLFAEQLMGKQPGIAWSDIDNNRVATTKTIDELNNLSKKHLLAITGNLLDDIFLWEDGAQVIKAIHVFSRTSPTQKGIIVGMLNSLGHKTLMCGDGTNDVGSLKRADVGLAIVNGKQPTKEEKAKKK